MTGQNVPVSFAAAVDTVSRFIGEISRDVHLVVEKDPVLAGAPEAVVVVENRTGRTLRRVPATEILQMARQIRSRDTDAVVGLLMTEAV